MSKYNLNIEKEKYDLLYSKRVYCNNGLESRRVKWLLNPDNLEERNDIYVPLRKIILDGTAKKTLLDVGCGGGDFGLGIKELNPSWDIDGMDISREGLEIANKTKCYCELHLMDISNISIEKKYDVVMFLDGMEHIHPEVENAAINNLFDLSKNYVILTISTVDGHHDKYINGHVHINIKDPLFWKDSILIPRAEEKGFLIDFCSISSQWCDVIFRKA